MGYDIENTENELIKFYDFLLENQEELPLDFQKVLNDNLWELMGS